MEAQASVAAPDARPDILSLSQAELATALGAMGEKPFRARQVFAWLHKRYAASFDEMTDLSRPLRHKLAEAFRLSPPTIELVQQSSDGTRKYKLKTTDGRYVEAVYMPDEAAGRRTLCVSSQVGCAMGCTFCLTATMGLVRHMTPGEIVGQVHRVNRDLMETVGLEGPRPLTNLVFMGMGEPLHNFDHLKSALTTLLSGDGPNFSHRHVTVSTSGLVPMIERAGRELEVKVAISLNASTDEVRNELMPVNRKWNIAALMEACRQFPLKQGRRITFEYVLLAGINDTDDDARRVVKLVRGLPAKVNLIPYNENPGLGFGEPTPERVESFRDILDRAGVTALVRKNRGRDISAACGQLAVAGQGRDRKPRVPTLVALQAAAAASSPTS
jgi:23S rRNA (adenine2503-C2)-methyltransferase